MGKSNKGSKFERDISRFFTKWLTGQSKELYFWRSPGSGSVSQINIGNKDISGDIIALKPEGKLLIDTFSIELKNGYPKTSLDNHLKDNKTDNLKDFWTQCTNDAIKNDKLPMLIYRKKGIQPWAGIDKIFFDVCTVKNELNYLRVKWHGLPELYLFDMKKFFKILKPKDLEEIVYDI